jgi:rhamnosyltransferase
MKTTLIIPTLNAGSDWITVLEGLRAQTVQPDQKILLDTCSSDETVELAKQHGFEVHRIKPDQFNHGLTRQYGATLCPKADIILMMTQDTVPANPGAFSKLLAPFSDPQVAAAYGRQLPRADAPPTEAFARLYNYPPESRIKTLADIPEHGLQTAFCSNSFAAWRKSALDQIGGFEDTPFGEDMLAAARLILAGHSIAYCADAEAIHSHPPTLREAFRRGRQIGQLHRHHPWLRIRFGSPEKTGNSYMRKGIHFLTRNSPLDIPLLLFQSATKLFGFLSVKYSVS